MWGNSYAGYNQWAAVKKLSPHLKTIVPAAAAYFGSDWPSKSGAIPFSYSIQWRLLTSGVTDNVRLFAEEDYWNSVYFRMYKQHLPFKSLSKLSQLEDKHFSEWVEHPYSDDYWDAANPTYDDYSRINLPILSITGHYDDDQPGSMEHYRRHMRFGSPEAKSKHYLILGPWDHGGTARPKPSVGGIELGDASLLDLGALHIQWYDWILKNGKKPAFLKKRIAYFVTGADTWKYADSLDEISTESRRLYLNSSNSGANSVLQSGSLKTEVTTVDVMPDSYVYDPLETRPGQLELEAGPDYLTDQTAALNLFGNGLVYHSEPFEEATEITGYVKLSLWLSIDVPDTDFQAVLYEIKKDGSSVMLAEDFLRARLRESRRAPKLVKPGEVLEYRFDRFNYFSRQLAEGSRLRLLIKSPNSIALQKNYNSGGVVAEESGNDARTAHIKLYHDEEHRSYLDLPIVN